MLLPFQWIGTTEVSSSSKKWHLKWRESEGKLPLQQLYNSCFWKTGWLVTCTCSLFACLLVCLHTPLYLWHFGSTLLLLSRSISSCFSCFVVLSPSNLRDLFLQLSFCVRLQVVCPRFFRLLTPHWPVLPPFPSTTLPPPHPLPLAWHPEKQKLLEIADPKLWYFVSVVTDSTPFERSSPVGGGESRELQRKRQWIMSTPTRMAATTISAIEAQCNYESEPLRTQIWTPTQAEHSTSTSRPNWPY